MKTGTERSGWGVAAMITAAVLATWSAPARAQEAEDSAKDRSKQDLPLAGWEANRTVRVDLDEGSWISLDVSPDGSTIVFDFLGDLFTIPIEGGDATQLTSGMGFDAQPRYSPDGTWIAFQSDMDGGENLYLMRADGSDTVQITEGGANRIESPEWTPDGDYLVVSKGSFRGGGLPKLTLYHRKGGGGVQLIREPENLKTLGAAFGPDGRYVWFARRTGDWNYNAQFPQYQLAVYDRETGRTHTRSNRYGSGIRPTLSPDGRWLVYGTRHEEHTGLVLRDLESGSERWLAYPVQHDDQESRASRDALPGMSFTPDSEHLVASYGGKIWKIPSTAARPKPSPSGCASTWRSGRRWSSTTRSRTIRRSRSGRSATRCPPPTARGWPSPRWTDCTSRRSTARARAASRAVAPASPSTRPRGHPTDARSRTRRGKASRGTCTGCRPPVGSPSA